MAGGTLSQLGRAIGDLSHAAADLRAAAVLLSHQGGHQAPLPARQTTVHHAPPPSTKHTTVHSHAPPATAKDAARSVPQAVSCV